MRGLFHRQVLPRVEITQDAEAFAYTCLEEARLRLECLGACLPHAADQAGSHLCACHRHLGLAGLDCCTELGSGTRLRWLALAHDRLRSDERDPVTAVLDAIVRATDAVEQALFATDLADNIQTAHNHVLAACESFSAYLQFQASAYPRVGDIDPGSALRYRDS